MPLINDRLKANKFYSILELTLVVVRPITTFAGTLFLCWLQNFQKYGMINADKLGSKTVKQIISWGD